MIKALISFLCLWAIIFFGVEIFRKFTAKEKIKTLKLLMYSMGVAILTLTVLLTIVAVF